MSGPAARELISLREFARRKGWRSHSYAQRLVRRGYLTLTDGRIDPVLAEKQLAASGAGILKYGVTVAHQRAREEKTSRETGSPGVVGNGVTPAPRRATGNDADTVDDLVGRCQARVMAEFDELARQLRKSGHRKGEAR